jgi:acyl-coenzyme A synthetase/AMP-(fatty) acid ligase
MPDGEMGNIVVKLPMAPSCLPTLWGNDQRFIDAYLSKYPGYYLTGDAGYRDADGYLWIMSRTDDVINVAGHRLSTGAMEEVLAGTADVAECAVIGVADALKGQMPLGLIVLKAGVERDPASCGPNSSSGCAIRSGRWRRSSWFRRQAAAEDPLGQDPARHHGQDRRQRDLQDAGDDR